MYGRELNSRSYPEIGISEPHHGLSHHGDRPEQIEKFSRLNTYQVQLFAYFLDKLRSTPDGDGNLLDHTILLYGGAMSNPNVHLHVNLPLVVAGGGAGTLKGGRHLTFDPAKNVPMTNLLVSLLDKAGVAIDKLGDRTRQDRYGYVGGFVRVQESEESMESEESGESEESEESG